MNRITIAGFCLIVLLSGLSATARSEPPTILIATWRGCEDACRGVQDRFRERGIEANFIISDAARDKARLPQIATQARELGVDLVVSWGTSVTLGLLGKLAAVDPTIHITDIPVVFMIVADPVGAGLITHAEVSQRPNVTGTRNRIPEIVQIRAMRAYRPLQKLGLIYNVNEVNAVLKAEEMRNLATQEAFELVEFRIETATPDQEPAPEQIDEQITIALGAGLDFLYVASSSFLIANRDRLTATARDAGIALASAYEAMVLDSHELLSIAARYYNVGKLAGFQAEQILVHGADPATMPIRSLNRYSYIINMETGIPLVS